MTIDTNPVAAPGADIGSLRRRPYSPARAWLGIAILMVFSLLSFLDRQILALMVGPIKADLALSDTQLGLLQGLAFTFLYAFAGLPIGWLVDRGPRRLIIYAGITLWSLSAAYCGIARNFWQLFIGRTAVGVGEATMSPIAVSLIGDLFPPDRMATAFGVYSAGYFIGSGIAMAAGGMIVGTFLHQPDLVVPVLGELRPWQAVFLVTGLPGAVIALLAFAIRDPGRTQPRSIDAPAESASLVDHLRVRGRVTFHAFAGFSAAAVVSYVVPAWTPAFFMRHFGMQPQEIGWSFGLVMAGAGAFGAFGGGMLLDRTFRAGRTDAYFLLPGIGALIAAPPLAGAFFMPTPVLGLASLALGMAVYGVTSAATYSTWRRIAAPALRGQMTAAYILCGSLFGGGLGPVLVALLTDRVFQDEAKVGQSLAIVIASSLVLMSVLLLTGRRSMRALPD
jgi:MFS family permease